MYVWEAVIIGFVAAIMYFGSTHFVRYKIKLDQPLQVMSINLFSIAEGVVGPNIHGTSGSPFSTFYVI